MMADYADASLADASVSGSDLDADEGEALLLGPRVWRSRFPIPRVMHRDGGDPCSKHARRNGHRWGWLCRLVGYENFRKIAELPRPKRMAYIARLKAAATQMAQEQGYNGLMIAQ
jgi:hypothetical protein